MKAEEIRTLNVKYQELALGTKTPEGHEAAMLSSAVSMLTEVAAQLAEANEHLAKITEPLANSLSNLNDDPYRVVGCLPVLINGLEATEITLRNGSKFTTQGRYEEVCKKFGIPVR